MNIIEKMKHKRLLSKQYKELISLMSKEVAPEHKINLYSSFFALAFEYLELDDKKNVYRMMNHIPNTYYQSLIAQMNKGMPEFKLVSIVMLHFMKYDEKYKDDWNLLQILEEIKKKENYMKYIIPQDRFLAVASYREAVKDLLIPKEIKEKYE